MIYPLAILILYLLNIGWFVSVILNAAYEDSFLKHMGITLSVMGVVAFAFMICMLTIAPHLVPQFFDEDILSPEDVDDWITKEKYVNIIRYAKWDPTHDDRLILPDEVAKPSTLKSKVEFDLIEEDDEALASQAKKNVEDMMSAQLLTTENGLVTDEEIQEIIDKRPEFLSIQGIRDANKDWTTKEVFDEQKRRLRGPIQKINENKRKELENQEFKQLKFQRYLNEQSFSSQRQYANESRSPYNILPMDVWYRPAPNAKNLDGTPCMCPIQTGMLQTKFGPYKESTDALNKR